MYSLVTLWHDRRNAFNLRDLLQQHGDIVQCMHKGKLLCAVRREGDRYIMQSPRTGKHSLNVSCTDAHRLYTHWIGFTEVNRSRA